MSRKTRALAVLNMLIEREIALRYRRDRIGKRVKWYCYRLGQEGPLCRTPQQAVEQFVAQEGTP